MNKKHSEFESLSRAGFLSVIAGLFALFLQLMLGNTRMAISGAAGLIGFLILSGAFLLVAFWCFITRLMKPSPRDIQAAGPYKFVRHPVYGAIIFLLNPSLAILMRSWFLLIICVLAYFIWRSVIQAEEREAREIFGETYLKYQKNTSLFFPNLFLISKPIFISFWTLAVFIFIFIGLNFPALYLRAVDWPDNVEQQPVSRQPNRGDRRAENIVFLPSARPKYDKIDSIVINKIKTEAPLVFASGTSQNQLNAALDRGVVIYPGSKLPGEKGEVFLTGHSSVYPWNKTAYGRVFTMIDKLEAGDMVTIYYGQYKYDYKITKKSVVKPDEVRLNIQADKNTLTLMTCWPIGTALKRLVVEGILAE